MKTLIVFLGLFVGQMNTMQEKPTVRLHPNQNVIPMEFGGNIVELVDPPAVIQLPRLPPKPGAHGEPWFVELKNLSAAPVIVVGNAQFRVRIGVGRLVHIKSVGSGYMVGQ